MAAATEAPAVLADDAPVYGGVATRAVGLAVDSVIVWIALLILGAAFWAIGALFGGIHLGPVGKFLVGSAAIIFAGLYFVVSWTTAGRTVGQRMMGLRVIDFRGQQPRFLTAMIRTAMLGFCIVTCFVGFIPVLFDRRRRGVHDMVALTTVHYVPEEAADAITAGSSPTAADSR
jgi:uncharacterized RDD family membrane protein YckC